MNFAGIEPILAILVAVGWFIVKAILDRRADTDTWEEMDRPTPPRPPLPPRNPVPPTIPRTQQQPRVPTPPPLVLRPNQLPTPPQPVFRKPDPIRPLIIHEEEGPAHRDPAHRAHADDSYGHASHLQETIAKRFAGIDRPTASPKPTAPHSRPRPAAALNIVRMFRNPDTVRQAFLAQFVLNPPKSLE